MRYVELRGEPAHQIGRRLAADAAQREAGAIDGGQQRIRLQDIDETLSPWRVGSWVSDLISGNVSPPDCPDEVRHVVDLSMSMVEATRGYFSPFWRRLAFGDPGPDPLHGPFFQVGSDIVVQCPVSSPSGAFLDAVQ